MQDLVDPVALVPDAEGWFTRRAAGDLAHRLPHVPSRLGRARKRVAEAVGLESDDLHFMQQVHGADVGVVTEETVRGAEIRGVDVLVTGLAGRALAVQVADCVPVLIASHGGPVAAVHAGRRGLVAGVLEAALDHLARLGAEPRECVAAVGPAIGGCCYEVPEEMRDDVSAAYPEARAETTWGTPSLDLPRAVRTTLADASIRLSSGVDGCTRCDEEQRWFSHRGDRRAGRQLGIVVLREDS